MTLILVPLLVEGQNQQHWTDEAVQKDNGSWEIPGWEGNPQPQPKNPSRYTVEGFGDFYIHKVNSHIWVYQVETRTWWYTLGSSPESVWLHSGHQAGWVWMSRLARSWIYFYDSHNEHRIPSPDWGYITKFNHPLSSTRVVLIHFTREGWGKSWISMPF